MKPLLAVILLGLGGCAAAHEESPAVEHEQPDPTKLVWRLHIDTKGKGIGAYQIAVRWNAEVAVIEEILPCSPKQFAGHPNVIAATLTTGSTKINSIDTSGAKPRSGEWHLLTVIFRKVAPGMLSAKAEIEKLYDHDSKPFSGKLVDGELSYTFP